ncbi:unnamed protein product [Protopolystoma xenopodis]|uniref:Uncharacterized protein n=1 Tax=Protopolystoma xenopodis TaxID=117903 RepID=A0A3S5ALR1_9PLAT|nr:unnamed protein product [Protopolystoma xenopodis]
MGAIVNSYTSKWTALPVDSSLLYTMLLRHFTFRLLSSSVGHRGFVMQIVAVPFFPACPRWSMACAGKRREEGRCKEGLANNHLSGLYSSQSKVGLMLVSTVNGGIVSKVRF